MAAHAVADEDGALEGQPGDHGADVGEHVRAGVVGEVSGAVGEAVAALVDGDEAQEVVQGRGDFVPGVGVEGEAVQGQRGGSAAAPVAVAQGEAVGVDAAFAGPRY